MKLFTSWSPAPLNAGPPYVRQGGGAWKLCKCVGIGGVWWLVGCSGPQSALDPAGHGAERIANLFWWMTGGAGIIWLAVVSPRHLRPA